MDSTTSSSTHKTDSLSPFERLPPELVRNFIRFAPEAVFELRLTCRLLKTLVDDCAQSPLTGQLIEELSIYATREREQMLFAVTCYVPKHLSNIFEHRLKLCRCSFDGYNVKIMRRGETIAGKPNVYTLRLTASSVDQLLIFRTVCMGERVGKLVMINCAGHTTLSVVSQLIDGLKFDLMEFTAVSLQSDDANFILSSIPKHGVLHFALNMSTASNPVKFLLALSSILQSLYIYQCRIDSVAWKTNYMFGLLDVNWAPVILNMFSNKMDKLYIENRTYEGYLSLPDTDLLIACLPTIEGKKIWFEATCHNYPIGLDLVENEYSVQADHRNMCYRFLSIKHLSRVDESLDFPRIQ